MTTTPTRSTTRRRAPRGSGEQLRAEIIAATKRLLEESANADAVSIRQVADAVGVTPPSLYLHFADKDALIDAVVMDVFAELDAAMMASAAGIDEPMARLQALGLAYVRFAIDHPEHYRVATMGRCPTDDVENARPDELDMVLADAAFNHMVEAVTAAIAAGIVVADDPIPTTLQLWAAAHGAAALMVSKPYLPWGDKMAFANRVLRSAALGLMLNDVLGGDASPAEAVRWRREQDR